MQNENYYKSQLEKKIEEFLTEEADDNDFGWVGDNLSKLMADAAFAVLAASKDVQDYIEKNNNGKL